MPNTVTLFPRQVEILEGTIDGIRSAYRDGYQAAEPGRLERDQICFREGREFERERIQVLLAEPSEELLEELSETFWVLWAAALAENRMRHNDPQWQGVATAQFLPQLLRAVATKLGET